ncbi:hypothetical protein ACKVMT_01535 [Halobacteriales archaeon Cl-PHB]
MRGQTTLDFATGVSLFLLTIIFVFMFVPGTLQPFTQSAQEETVGANRVADLLVMDLLADSEEPYLLDGPCTAKLLGGTGAPACGFDGATLNARLDLPDRQHVNITIRGNFSSGTKRLCWDQNADSVVAASSGDCDVQFAAGDSPPESSGSTVTARRMVSIRGTTASLEVRMW